MAFIAPMTILTRTSFSYRCRLRQPLPLYSQVTGVNWNRSTIRCSIADSRTDSSSFPTSEDEHFDERFNHYEKSLQQSREAMISRVFAMEATKIGDNQALALAFMLFVCCRGVRMTAPVEGWLLRTSESCRKLGFNEYAEHFKHHAGEEKGHSLMYESDTRRLVDRWNEKFPDYLLSADRLLLADFLTPGEQAFSNLHDKSIDSDVPICTLPIVYEIERLAVSLAPALLKNLIKCIGDSVENDLSFINYHIYHDVHHRVENEHELRRMLNEYDEHTEEIISFGKKALEAYGDYLDDCFVLASAVVADMKLK